MTEWIENDLYIHAELDLSFSLTTMIPLAYSASPLTWPLHRPQITWVWRSILGKDCYVITLFFQFFTTSSLFIIVCNRILDQAEFWSYLERPFMGNQKTISYPWSEINFEIILRILLTESIVSLSVLQFSISHINKIWPLLTALSSVHLFTPGKEYCYLELHPQSVQIVMAHEISATIVIYTCWASGP